MGIKKQILIAGILPTGFVLEKIQKTSTLAIELRAKKDKEELTVKEEHELKEALKDVAHSGFMMFLKRHMETKGGIEKMLNDADQAEALADIMPSDVSKN